MNTPHGNMSILVNAKRKRPKKNLDESRKGLKMDQRRPWVFILGLLVAVSDRRSMFVRVAPHSLLPRILAVFHSGDWCLFRPATLAAHSCTEDEKSCRADPKCKGMSLSGVNPWRPAWRMERVFEQLSRRGVLRLALIYFLKGVDIVGA